MSPCPLAIASRLAEFASRLDEVRAPDRRDMEQAVCELHALVHRLGTGVHLDLQPRDPAVNLGAAVRMLRENAPFEGTEEMVLLGNLDSCIDEMFRGLEASQTPLDSLPPLTSWFH